MNVGAQLSALSAAFLLCMFPQERGHCGLRVAGVAVQLFLPFFETSGPVSAYAAMDWDEESDGKTNSPKLHRRRVGSAGNSRGGESARRMQRQPESDAPNALAKNASAEAVAAEAPGGFGERLKEPDLLTKDRHSPSSHSLHHQPRAQPEEAPHSTAAHSRHVSEDSVSEDSVSEEESSGEAPAGNEHQRRQITQKELQQQKERLKQKYGVQ